MSTARSFVVCIENEGYGASLELRKIYPKLDDPEAERDDLIRVVDESGEDDLYPSELFVPIESPEGAERAFATVL